MKLPVFLEDIRSVDSMQITPIHRIAAIHFLITSACGELNKFRAYYREGELAVSKSGADVPSLRDSWFSFEVPGTAVPGYPVPPLRGWGARIRARIRACQTRWRA